MTTELRGSKGNVWQQLCGWSTARPAWDVVGLTPRYARTLRPQFD